MSNSTLGKYNYYSEMDFSPLKKRKIISFEKLQDSCLSLITDITLRDKEGDVFFIKEFISNNTCSSIRYIECKYKLTSNTLKCEYCSNKSFIISYYYENNMKFLKLIRYKFIFQKSIPDFVTILIEFIKKKGDLCNIINNHSKISYIQKF